MKIISQKDRFPRIEKAILVRIIFAKPLRIQNARCLSLLKLGGHSKVFPYDTLLNELHINCKIQ